MSFFILREDSTEIAQVALALIGPVKKRDNFEKRKYAKRNHVYAERLNLYCLGFRKDMLKTNQGN